jgi:integrase
MATSRLKLDTKRTLADGTHAVVIVLQMGKAYKYVSTGVRCLAEKWDERTRRPRGIAQREKNHLDHLLAEAARTRMELEKRRTLTLDAWRQAIVGSTAQANTLGAAMEQRIAQMQRAGATGNATIYAGTLTKLRQANRHATPPEAVDYAWLQGWTVELQAEGLKPNTVALHMRTLRALINELVRRGVLSRERYAFEHYRMPKPQANKRALTIDELRRLWHYTPHERNVRQRRALDMMRMSLLLRGMNLVDMLAVRPAQLRAGRLVYTRKKTGTHYNVALLPQALAIAEKYKGEKLWLAWGEGAGTPTEIALSQNGQVSIACRAIGYVLGIERLQYYSMRHSFATLARSLGYPRDLIAQALGHKMRDTTESYLLEYDMQLVDDMHRAVVELVVGFEKA